ncbi:MAG: hypothetical protein PHN44_00235 [Candidatus Marinimicrobia bacterium]|jgi:hypothetical protein|nr:hypothetical protein [Candidatus Neomarinimicrobiota bacterium]
MVIVAHDPGTSGGFATFNTHTKEATCRSVPDTDTGIVDYLKSLRVVDPYEKPLGSRYVEGMVHLVSEKVGGFIGLRKSYVNIVCPHCKGIVPYETSQGDPGSTMFKFGDGNGFVRGVCIALGFGYDTIAPRSWQKIHNLYKERGMSKTQWKNILKDRAQKLFPNLKVTLSTADALLILDVALRMPRIQSI